MKLATIEYNEQQVPVVLEENGEFAIPLKTFGLECRSIVELIDEYGDKLEELEQLIERTQITESDRIRKSEFRMLAPIPKPARDVICMGLNYKVHDPNDDVVVNTWPSMVFFGKAVDRARGDGEVIPSHSDFVSTVNGGCELAVIIGKRASHVKAEDAEDYIFGYTIINDVEAGELNRYKQNYFMKSLDGFCPMGPVIVTKDAIAYPPKLAMHQTVNDLDIEIGNTEDMIYSIAEIIQELSQGITLEPGTIISTGNPVKIGAGVKPTIYYKPGDIVTCSIEGIGDLHNPVE